jgi:hypothetical protein
VPLLTFPILILIRVVDPIPLWFLLALEITLTRYIAIIIETLITKTNNTAAASPSWITVT